MKNLSICERCNNEPATYGDGVTWALGSKCFYEQNKTITKSSPDPVPDAANVIEHTVTPGLISVIMPVYIANYSLFHYTGNAIGAIREHTNKEKTPYELIVVDNGSPIPPPKLESYYADKVIKWDENKGVTKAWNAGIRASFGEYIVLINNDTQIYDHCLEAMKAVLENSDVELVMAHPMYSLTEPFARATEARKIMAEYNGQEIEKCLSDFRDFSCVMFKKSLLDELGMFDEDFFSYASDSDLLKRMEKVGKRYACCEATPIHHIIDATGAAIPETADIMNKDKERFQQKWQNG